MTKKRIDPGPFIVPMPLVLIGSTVDGKPNFMPAAFVGIVNFMPPTIACGLSPTHHTCKGIEASRTFSINIPSPDMACAADWCGLNSGVMTDKSSIFNVFYGELKTAPMIEECRLAAECKLIQSTPLGVDTLYLGEIVASHVEEDALTGGKVDWAKLSPYPFTFPDNQYWKMGERFARAWSCGKTFKPKKAGE